MPFFESATGTIVNNGTFYDVDGYQINTWNAITENHCKSTNASDSLVEPDSNCNSGNSSPRVYELGHTITHTHIRDGDNFLAPIYDSTLSGRGNTNPMRRNKRAPEAPSRDYESGHNANATIHDGDNFSAQIYGSIVGGRGNVNSINEDSRTPEPPPDIQLQRKRLVNLQARLLAQLHEVRTLLAKLESSDGPEPTTTDQPSCAVTALPAYTAELS